MSAFTFKDQAFLASTRSAGITPDSFPGLLRWYRADDYVGVDGNTVGGGANTLGPWIDRTGSGDDANQTVLTGPVYKTAIFGARPVIRFILEFLNFVPGGLNDFTVISVNQKTSTSSFLVQNAGNNHQIRRSFLGDNITLFFAGAAGVPADPFGSPNNVLSLAVRRNGTAVTFRENKTARGGGNEAGVWTVNEIGSSVNGGRIDIGELMIWNTVLSDADVDSLYDNYLKPRYPVLP